MDIKIIKQLLFALLLVSLSSSISAQINAKELQLIEADKQLFLNAVKLSEQGHWLKAEPIYRELMQRNADWPEPKNNLAIALIKTDRMDEARKMLEQAISSSPSYRIAQENRTQLYNYLATQAYDKALGSRSKVTVPEMELIKAVDLPVKLIEKTVEKKVEVVVEKEVIVEKPVIVERVVEKIIKESPAVDSRQAVGEFPEDDAAVEVSPVDANAIEQNVDIINRVEQQLIAWSRAWSRGDFEFYIKYYSENFIPSDDRKTFTEWKNIRRGRLTYAKGVNVSFDQLRVFVEPQGEYILAEFMQYYKSASYSDQVLKQMYMQKEKNNWRILSERTIKTF